MEINSLQGAAVYSNAAATPSVENTQLRNQNIESSRSDLDTRTANTAREAFEVNLTQEAQNLSAGQTVPQENLNADQSQARPPENQNTPAAESNDTSRIVNIVA